MRSILVMLLAFTFVSCGPTSGTISALIVAPIDENMTKFGLKVVKLPRIVSISELRGERFVFKAGSNLSWAEYSKSIEENDCFEDARADLLQKSPLADARPRLSWNGEYYRAVDFDSLYMLTAYYWLEQVAEFFTTVVKDQSKAARTPISVSVYGSFTSKGIIKVPFGFIDNSAYLPLEDMFKMYRVADQEGLPFEMNPGVVAHEFQHRVFHDLVFQSKAKEGYQAWKKLTSTDSGLKYTRARLLLRATDEGLSDVAALGFSTNPNFLADEHRNLNGDFANVATYDNLADSTIDARFANACNGESLNYGNPTWRYYCLGTVIAKTIWEAVDHDVGVLRTQVLPVLNQSLEPLSVALVEKFEKYDLDILWRLVLQRVPQTLQPKLCAQIKVRFRSLYDGIKECA